MGKILRFVSYILERGIGYSIHVSIIVLAFAVIFCDFIWSEDINKTIGIASADNNKVYEVDVKRVDKLLSYMTQLVPPMTTGVNIQDVQFLTQGASFLTKPSLLNTIISTLPREKMTTYTVSEGETYWTIAYKFEINVDTLKWANDGIEDWEDLKPGQELVVLPTNGLLYTVGEDDSLKGIASFYGLSLDKIKTQNKLASADLVAGQQLVLPGARKYRTYTTKPVTNIGTQTYEGPVLAGSGDFRWPVNTYPRYITQYFGWVTKWYKHTGIDLDRRNGVDILASDRGTIVSAKYGYGGGYGNHIIIDHGNGFQTLYAHLSAINVSVGDDIEAGKLLGIMGTTGYSTGVHLHFEIRYDGAAQNPIAYLK